MVPWIFSALIRKGSPPIPVIAYVPVMKVCCPLLQGGTCQGSSLSSLPAPRSGTRHRLLTQVGKGWPRLTPREARASCSAGMWNLLPIKRVMLMESFQLPLLLTLIYTARHRPAFRRTRCKWTRGSPCSQTSPHSKWEGTHLEDNSFCNASKSSQSLPP